MNVGDYVVYIRGGHLNRLGENVKDIWEITHTHSTGEMLGLKSLSKPKNFTASSDNIVAVSEIVARNEFKRKYFVPAAYEYVMSTEKPTAKSYRTATGAVKFIDNKIVGDTRKMSYSNQDNKMVQRTATANIDAAKVAATIATGRTVNAVFINKFRNQLPMLVRGYADTPLGAVVIANAVDFAVKQFATDNQKFNYVSNAMMQAAMVDLLAEFDFESIFNDVLNGVTLGEIDDGV